jgi:HD superfamily phosphodiesterase
MSFRKLKNLVLQKYSSEVSDHLSYHGTHHIIEVLNSCNQYIKRYKLDLHERLLLRTAAIFHDIGILWSYDGHEEMGTTYLKKILPNWNYSQSDIDIICQMISSTKIPQQPKTLLDKILCDADLDYLGTNKFYEIGQTLYQELLALGIVKNERDWDQIQISFLDKHQYHTDFALKYRAPKKEKFKQELIAKYS